MLSRCSGLANVPCSCSVVGGGEVDGGGMFGGKIGERIEVTRKGWMCRNRLIGCEK